MINNKFYHYAMIAILSVFYSVVLTTNGVCEMKEASSGLKYLDSVEGKGKEAVKGSHVTVDYTGWLNNSGNKGNEFDSSVKRGVPFDFLLGAGQVIKGWDEGFSGMKVGGKRTLYIPADLGYGSRGAPGAIPPNADLIFDVELLDVK